MPWRRGAWGSFPTESIWPEMAGEAALLADLEGQGVGGGWVEWGE